MRIRSIPQVRTMLLLLLLLLMLLLLLLLLVLLLQLLLLLLLLILDRFPQRAQRTKTLRRGTTATGGQWRAGKARRLRY